MLSSNNMYLVDTTSLDPAKSFTKVDYSALNASFNATCSITFSDGFGEVGRFYVENKNICFEGNMDESARLFVKHINFDLEKMRELAYMSGELEERQRILDLIDEWVDNPMALVTDLVKKIKQPVSIDK